MPGRPEVPGCYKRALSSPITFREGSIPVVDIFSEEPPESILFAPLSTPAAAGRSAPSFDNWWTTLAESQPLGVHDLRKGLTPPSLSPISPHSVLSTDDIGLPLLDVGLAKVRTDETSPEGEYTDEDYYADHPFRTASQGVHEAVNHLNCRPTPRLYRQVKRRRGSRGVKSRGPSHWMRADENSFSVLLSDLLAPVSDEDSSKMYPLVLFQASLRGR